MKNQDNRFKDAADLSAGAGQTPADAAALRQRAEAQARNTALTALSAHTPEEIHQAIHELRVHQIELEMQNEELRTAQTLIEAGRARYFDLYDLAPVGYCTLSEKGLILEANLTAATLLAVARSALNQQPLSRFILKEDQDIYYLNRKQLFETNEPQECELRLVKSDGTAFWAHLTTAAVPTEGAEPLSRVVISDITTRKQAENEIKKQLAEKEILLRENHHRIMNNITTIASLLNRQASEVTNLEAKTILREAVGRVFSMGELYRKMLVADSYHHVFIDQYLLELMDAVVSLFSGTTRVEIEKHLDRFSIDPKMAFMVGIITNELLTNAMKYAFSGRDSGTIKVSLHKTGNEVTLTIQDDGIGMPDDPDPKTSKRFGLNLVRMLANQLEGSFSIESHQGTKSVLEFGV